MNSAALRIRPGAPQPAIGVVPADPAPMSASVKAARCLIWIYLLLWIFEGVFRKWFLVSLSDVLLIIRDPVVVGIYAAALVGKVFPFNLFVVSIAVLGGLSTMAGMAVLPELPAVVIFGFRANFLHLPLIFVMGRVLTSQDLRRIVVFILAVAILQILLMAKQYRSGTDSWWNLGAGGGRQIEAVRGVVRPAGTFSYISGPVIYFSMCLALLLGSLGFHRWTRWWLMIPAMGAIILACSIAGSRSLLGACAVVAATYVVGCVLYPRAFKGLLKLIAAAGVVAVLVAGSSLYQAGRETTSKRTNAAFKSEGGLVESVWTRSIRPIFVSILYSFETDILGRGLGLGTNGGAALAGRRGDFVIAEDEWPRVLTESGPILGLAYMTTRVGLVLWLLGRSMAAARTGNLMPVSLFGACFLGLATGQFGQPTTLGGSVLIAGMIVASLKIPGGENAFPRKASEVSAPPPKPLHNRSSSPKVDQIPPFSSMRHAKTASKVVLAPELTSISPQTVGSIAPQSVNELEGSHSLRRPTEGIVKRSPFAVHSGHPKSPSE